MESRVRLVDVTKLNKSSWLVQQESEALLREAEQNLKAQSDLMSRMGLDRKALREFINNDQWTTVQRHKARQELVGFNETLKRDMSDKASEVRKDIRLASRLLKPKNKRASSSRRQRSGFV